MRILSFVRASHGTSLSDDYLCSISRFPRLKLVQIVPVSGEESKNIPVHFKFNSFCFTICLLFFPVLHSRSPHCNPLSPHNFLPVVCCEWKNVFPSFSILSMMEINKINYLCDSEFSKVEKGTRECRAAWGVYIHCIIL